MSITVETNDGIETDVSAEQKEATLDESSQGTDEQDSASQEDETAEDSETSEQTDEESEESDDDDSESDEESDDEEQEKDKEEKPKRKSGFKKRIDKLNKRISDRDQYIQNLQRQLDELKQGKPAEEKQPQENQKQLEAAFGIKRPDPNEFDDYTDYVEALTDYKVQVAKAKDQVENEVRQKQSEQEKLLQNFQSKVKDFAKETPDFEDVITDVDDIVATPALQMAILESHVGPQLMYELAKNPDEFRRVNALGEKAIDRAIGRLEAKIELSMKSSKQEKGEKRKTSAPKPLEKVGTRGQGTAKSLSDPNLSQREFERLRAEQLKTKQF